MWTENHQKHLKKLKPDIIPPLLYLPIAGGCYILHSDTCHTHVGRFLWQMQRGHPHSISYTSKTLHSTNQNYNVTELEMTGLLISISLWRLFSDLILSDFLMKLFPFPLLLRTNCSNNVIIMMKNQKFKLKAVPNNEE